MCIIPIFQVHSLQNGESPTDGMYTILFNCIIILCTPINLYQEYINVLLPVLDMLLFQVFSLQVQCCGAFLTDSGCDTDWDDCGGKAENPRLSP